MSERVHEKESLALSHSIQLERMQRELNGLKKQVSELEKKVRGIDTRTRGSIRIT